MDTITHNQLRAGRLLARLGLRELARITKCNVSTLQAIEAGRTKNPRAHTLEVLRLALENRDIEFAPHGWVRHIDDGAPKTVDIKLDESSAPHDPSQVLLSLAERMERAISQRAHHGARVLRVLADEELCMHQSLILDALRIGLLALIGQEISVFQFTVRSKTGESDVVEIFPRTKGGYLIQRALIMLGDDPVCYRQVQPSQPGDGALMKLETLRLERERKRMERERKQLEAERKRLVAERER